MTLDQIARLAQGGTATCPKCGGAKSRSGRNVRARACAVCNGSGRVQACSQCEASGYSHETRGSCGRCEGRGYVGAAKR